VCLSVYVAVLEISESMSCTFSDSEGDFEVSLNCCNGYNFITLKKVQYDTKKFLTEISTHFILPLCIHVRSFRLIILG
jgi:hypothetical protein